MSKHLQNLQRLCQKMATRYGKDDDLVLELKQEVTSLEAKKSKNLEAASHGQRRQDRREPSQPLH